MTQFLDYEGLKTFAKTIDSKFVRKDGIDTTFAEVVASLPTDVTKIKKHLYLVKNASSTESQNAYSEYIYIGEIGTGKTYDASKWEKLGEFKASIDLSGYATKAQAVGTIDKSVGDTYVQLTSTHVDGSPGTSAMIEAASATKAGVMSADNFNKLQGIASGANKTIVDSTLSSTSTNPVQNKVINSNLTTINSELGKKATKNVATTSADGLMSAADKKAFDILKGRYPLTINSFTASPSLLEVEASADITFTWALSNTDFHDSYSQEIVVDGATPVSVEKSKNTYKKTALVGATSATTKSAVINITESGKTTISKSVSITYHYPTYIGVVANGTTVNETLIKGLTKSIEWSKSKTSTLSQVNQLIVYAYPKNYGTLVSIKDGNGFEGIGGYTVSTITVDGQEYYVYVQKLPATASSTYKFA